jgi:endonuclease-3
VLAEKQPFDLDEALARVRAAVQDLPRAALFALYDEGFTSVFEQIVACMLSVRTRDEVTLVAARRLFAVARTPEAMRQLAPGALDALIQDSVFHEVKTRNILAIASLAVHEYQGSLPCNEAILRALPGVGPKCANLALGIACGEPRIGVDIHVHRVLNRWGYVATNSPEATLKALEAKVPRRYWLELNPLLMPFGKHICTGTLPRCRSCPVLRMCSQVGVLAHR